MPSNEADDLVIAIKNSEKVEGSRRIKVTSVDPIGHRWRELRSGWPSLLLAR